MAKNRFLSPLYLILILLTYSVSGNRINPSDLAALRQIQDSLTDIPSAVAAPFFSTWDFSVAAPFFSTWDFSVAADPYYSFASVTCSSSRVTILALGTGLSDSPGLAGTLSPAIADLTELTQLILFSGIVTGPIPPALASLRNLKVISLTNNRLTGRIPPQIFSLSNLHTLDLSQNQLSGDIPPATNQLKVLVLASIRLSGQIPRTIPA
ncbi:hypothetical protein ACS0TY_005480 [Phlomoides rotata]